MSPEFLGGKLIDYFSTAEARPLSEAETLDDVQLALQMVNTYIAMDKLEDAWIFYKQGLFDALRLNLEAYEKICAILRPFFSDNWKTLKINMPGQDALLFNNAGIALSYVGLDQESIYLHTSALLIELKSNDLQGAIVEMLNIASRATELKRLASFLTLF